MALPNTRNTTYVAGSVVPSVDLNAIQDSIVLADYVRSQVGDSILGASGRLLEEDLRPSTAHLWCKGAGGAPVSSGGARQLTNLAGVIAQALSGTIDGITPQVNSYYL